MDAREIHKRSGYRKETKHGYNIMGRDHQNETQSENLQRQNHMT